jgi:hypothetical protein
MLYHGRHAFSEPETYALGRYLLSRRNELKVFLDIHSFGQLIMSPWGHTRQYSPHYKNIQVYVTATSLISKIVFLLIFFYVVRSL